MSGICGFFNLDGAPAQTDILDRMLAAAEHRGPDGSSRWCGGSVALAHQHNHHLQLQRHCEQPLRDEALDLTLVLHGRIDNRRELGAALGLSAALPPLADAQLVLHAYQKWHEDCSAKLLGDFAFVVWDGSRRRLFASRDPSGCTPLFYAMDARQLVFGSEQAQVLAHPCVSRGVNEAMVGEFLSTGITSRSETLFEDVQRLPPGQQLTATSTGMRLGQHWSYEPRDPIHYPDQRQYVEHFLSLFRTAVGDRLDGVSAPGVMLSGGMDSPAVAALVQQQLKKSGISPHCVSLIDPENPDIDEGPYIDDVLDMWQLQTHRLPVQQFELPDWHQQVAASLDLPQFPNEILSAKLHLAAREQGVTTVFTGTGANSALGGSAFVYGELLRAGQWRAAGEEFLAQWRDDGAWQAMRRVVPSLGWPLLPRPVRALAERRRKFPYRSPFIEEAFARRIALDDRHHAGTPQGRFNNLATSMSWWSANNGAAAYTRETQERREALSGVVGVHPFLDRRLQEFVFSLPNTVNRRGGKGKRLLADSGLLPKSIVQDSPQGDYGGTLRAALCCEEVQQVLANLSISEQGWVSQQKVDEALHWVRRTDGAGIWSTPMPPIYLWMVFSVELWFQTAIIQANAR